MDLRRLWRVLLELTQGLDIQAHADGLRVTFRIAWSIAAALGGEWATTAAVWRRRQKAAVGLPTDGLCPLLHGAAQEAIRWVLRHTPCSAVEVYEGAYGYAMRPATPSLASTSPSPHELPPRLRGGRLWP